MHTSRVYTIASRGKLFKPKGDSEGNFLPVGRETTLLKRHHPNSKQKTARGREEREEESRHKRAIYTRPKHQYRENKTCQRGVITLWGLVSFTIQ
jgi:hypothetical protein